MSSLKVSNRFWSSPDLTIGQRRWKCSSLPTPWTISSPLYLRLAIWPASPTVDGSYLSNKPLHTTLTHLNSKEGVRISLQMRMNVRTIYLGYANAIAVPWFAALHDTPNGSLSGLVLMDTVLDCTKDNGSRPGDARGKISLSYACHESNIDLLGRYVCSHYRGSLRVKRPDQLYFCAVLVVYVVFKPPCQVVWWTKSPD